MHKKKKAPSNCDLFNVTFNFHTEAIKCARQQGRASQANVKHYELRSALVGGGFRPDE